MTGCVLSNKGKPPIEEGEFAKLYAGLLVRNAACNNGPAPASEEVRKRSVEATFSAAGVSMDQVQKTMEWYAADAARSKHLLDLVIATLDRKPDTTKTRPPIHGPGT